MVALTAALASALVAGAAPAPPAVASTASPCPTSPGPDEHSGDVDYRFGGLSEAVLLVDLPAERFQHLVPASYQLLPGTAPDRATLVAAYGSVESLTVGCDRARPATVAEFGVRIASPDGSEGRHAYYLWQLSDDRVLVERMRALGVPSHLADVAFSTVTSPDGQVEIAAQTLWSGSPSSLTARAAEPGTTPGPSLPGVRFWSEGRRGTTVVAYECPSCLPRTPATGTVQAAPGSPLDAVLGETAQPGVGFFIRTDLTARARTVGRPGD